MKVTSLAVSYERSFNLGNYESVKIGAQMWAQVDFDEDSENVQAFLFEECKKAVADNVPPHYQPQPTVNKKHTVSGLEVK